MVTWLDVTFQAEGPAEVEPTPAGNLEITFNIPELPSAKFTVIIPGDHARTLVERSQELLMLMPATSAGPSGD